MKRALGISVWGKIGKPEDGCDLYLDTWKNPENEKFLGVEIFEDRKETYLRKAIATIHLSTNTIRKLIELLEGYLPNEQV